MLLHGVHELPDGLEVFEWRGRGDGLRERERERERERYRDRKTERHKARWQRYGSTGRQNNGWIEQNTAGR